MLNTDSLGCSRLKQNWWAQCGRGAGGAEGACRPARASLPSSQALELLPFDVAIFDACVCTGCSARRHVSPKRRISKAIKALVCLIQGAFCAITCAISLLVHKHA